MTTALRRRALVSALLASAAFSTSALAQGAAQDPGAVSELIITATARPEERSRVTGTVQVLDQNVIQRSTAKSLTDLLAESSVAFMSEWTPAQTSINIRGGASDGQGRDFLGGVLVLVNGRRAGTSNLSKLSGQEVQRIEVVRGPSSVVYGSQNIGGVVNIITSTGKDRPVGAQVDASVGSWGFALLHADFTGSKDKFDWYFGGSLSKRGNYDSGEGGSEMLSTQYERRGFLASIGYEPTDNQRIELSTRSDGTYNAGFRGSGSNIVSKEDRYNQSTDLTYTGDFLGGRFGLTAHGSFVRDIDDLRWASPVLRSGNNPTPGTQKDWNKRQQDITGLQVRPQFKLLKGNTLLTGFDYEQARLRSGRYREAVVGAPTLAPIGPLDNNQTDTNRAFYFEDSQELLDGKVTLRGGLRRTDGKMRFDPTPNLVSQVSRSIDYGRTTYSVGAVVRPVERLAIRAGYSTGFRVPNATQLAGDTTALGGGRTIGNPNLIPENSEQFEVGAYYAGSGFTLDAALFQNVIHDRILTRARTGTTISDVINNPADIFVQGLELQGTVDVLRALNANMGDWRLSLRSSGYYNFQMKDKGAAATANSRQVQRMYLYEASFAARLGQDAGFLGKPWNIELAGILRGPVWYDTEENLLVPQAEPNNTFIHRKSPFWVFNLRGDVALSDRITLSGAVNNILDKNEHPLFIAIDKAPYKADLRFQNGGRGTSMPGREFVARIQARF